MYIIDTRYILDILTYNIATCAATDVDTPPMLMALFMFWLALIYVYSSNKKFRLVLPYSHASANRHFTLRYRPDKTFFDICSLHDDLYDKKKNLHNA